MWNANLRSSPLIRSAKISVDQRSALRIGARKRNMKWGGGSKGDGLRDLALGNRMLPLWGARVSEAH